ncbi:DODA-type extradiol aromatic ring-opening family dioxygenase [Amorphus orientalis]|uniref:4,5-DOPA dioxygenase extradiol n=1 Tax=Amorphus orientalis TaxID=649198 RepID=A0AAE3VPL9_9HYPH|nr:class III extradiol ring-cleavage dioxygenase [Amorphus orientalis]MDQ0315962.1 4,5-DOPA dioxygenase extradiol [Amorphus orientalis]
MLPTLFLSHGSPMLVLTETPAHRFLASYAEDLERPSAIVLVSAHYETELPAALGVSRPRTIHDFGGFDRKLFEMTYPAPGDPDLASRVAEHLSEAGLSAGVDERWGFDHGVWVPLKLLYPQADIPVVAVSVQPQADARHHFEVGRALAPLREEGILVIGSGSLTHNLGAIRTELGRNPLEADAPEWVTTFAEWMNARISEGELDALLDYRRQAPFAAENHPTDEHLMPLFSALGAAGETGRGRRIHSSHEYGALMMDAYAFG